MGRGGIFSAGPWGQRNRSEFVVSGIPGRIPRVFRISLPPKGGKLNQIFRKSPNPAHKTPIRGGEPIRTRRCHNCLTPHPLPVVEMPFKPTRRPNGLATLGHVAQNETFPQGGKFFIADVRTIYFLVSLGFWYFRVKITECKSFYVQTICFVSLGIAFPGIAQSKFPIGFIRFSAFAKTRCENLI